MLDHIEYGAQFGVGKRELKKRQLREDILRAAAEIFKDKGYSETAIADIMNKAERGVGTFYNYFSSKEELLMALLGLLGERIETEIAKGRDEKRSSLHILETASLVTAELIDEHRYVLPLFVSAANYAAGTAEGEQLLRPDSAPIIKHIFVSIISEGQEKKEIRQDIPGEVIAEVFHSLFQAAAFSQLDIPFVENIRLKTRALLDGIRAVD